MTRQAKAAVIRQGQQDAEILARLLEGKEENAPLRIRAMADRLIELAKEPRP